MSQPWGRVVVTCIAAGFFAGLATVAFAQSDADNQAAQGGKDVKVLTPPVPVDEPKPSGDSKGEEDETRKALEGLGQGGAGGNDPIIELLDDIGKNMKSIEELLNQPNTGSSTQGLQGKTLDQIEKLIEEIQKRGTT
ncbi:MAG: hypothetical protein AB7O52_00910 [Planctomycetota bacterium]